MNLSLTANFFVMISLLFALASFTVFFFWSKNFLKSCRSTSFLILGLFALWHVVAVFLEIDGASQDFPSHDIVGNNVHLLYVFMLLITVLVIKSVHKKKYQIINSKKFVFLITVVTVYALISFTTKWYGYFYDSWLLKNDPNFVPRWGYHSFARTFSYDYFYWSIGPWIRLTKFISQNPNQLQECPYFSSCYNK